MFMSHKKQKFCPHHGNYTICSSYSKAQDRIVLLAIFVRRSTYQWLHCPETPYNLRDFH